MRLNYGRLKADHWMSGKVTETKLDGNLGFKVVPKGLCPVWDLERGVGRSAKTFATGRTGVSTCCRACPPVGGRSEALPFHPPFLYFEMTDECCRKSFGSSLFDTAARFLQDPTPATDRTKRERLDICCECEHNKNGICDLCGCVLQLKTGFRNMECPAGKWPVEEVSQ